MKLKALLEQDVTKINVKFSEATIEHNRINIDLSGTDVNDFKIINATSLTTLKGCPRSCEIFEIRNCRNITTLEFAPMIARDSVYISECPKITSLSGIGKRYFKQIKGYIYNNGLITSSMLGLLLVKDLELIMTFSHSNRLKAYTEAAIIINNHLQEDRDIMEAREELVQAGLKDYAKL